MMRRIIDILFAVLFLVLTLPALLVISVLIKLETPGPVFYKQAVVGWKGKQFGSYRFRTMFLSKENDTHGRLTRVGRRIRNVSLDHLPQFINLLKGDVTLIGPRPMEVSVVDLQDPTWQEYVQVKPGLINYAIYKLGNQWTPSRSTRPELNQELELQYRKQRSIRSDAKLFLKSLYKLIASKGNIKERGDPDQDLNQQ